MKAISAAWVEQFSMDLKSLGADCMLRSDESDEEQMRDFLDFLVGHLHDLGDRLLPLRDFLIEVESRETK